MGFRNLQRYDSQKARFDKYKAWLAMSPDQRAAAYAVITDETRRASAEREKGYISPFGTAGTTKVFLPARILKTGQIGQGSGVAEVLRGLLAGFTLTTAEYAALTTPILVDTQQYKFAKLALTTVVPGTEKKNSRITGAAYKKPDVDTVSSPFGQKTGGQDYDAAMAAIMGEAAFATFVAGNNGKNRFKFTPEG
ncbi:hypothetical protein NIES4103_70290 (plasmid) [Nostoc sp. NIES-4103]|nr:hypothetical protein NIES4103_27410 [Nostoc sp. NIES-4103]BAZ54344.1 hypothetical protein NIES4103_70290 [Nostoc sp. NIES-4103]